jgi:hypothetical protein
VQEFLRRTQQQQPDRERPAARRDSRAIEVLVPAEQPNEERRTISEPFRPMQSPPVPPPVLPRATVAEYVAAPRSFGWQSSQLGKRIIAEDENFDIQLNAKFDHTVGTLAALRPSDEPAALVLPSESPVGQLAAMLSSPSGMRQAIVLNEILQRPIDRW